MPDMRLRCASVGGWVLWLALAVRAISVSVDRDGRSIQRDGFLPEWDPAGARSLGAVEGIAWDAVNTPEGLAGYIKVSRARTCSTWVIKFYPNTNALQRYWVMPLDGTGEGAFYSIYEWENDSVGMLSAEWVIPWDSLAVDSAGRYEMGLHAVGACGDTAEALVLTGRKRVGPQERDVLTPKVTAQITIVGILLVLYFVLQARARKKYSRK